ncbi:hypothetical protein EDB86DRAFT_2823961 [Lactarius hatsudake]|nr:hypothetical protein EDB86DRAFT_2823961 [Lactarius hatsudake]
MAGWKPSSLSLTLECMGSHTADRLSFALSPPSPRPLELDALAVHFAARSSPTGERRPRHLRQAGATPPGGNPAAEHRRRQRFGRRGLHALLIFPLVRGPEKGMDLLQGSS